MIMGQETYGHQESDSPQTPFLEGLGWNGGGRGGIEEEEGGGRGGGGEGNSTKIEGKTEIAG